MRIGTAADRVGGWGHLEHAHGYRILDLHGTDRRIGQLYAELLHDELHDHYLPAERKLAAALPAPVRTALDLYRSRFADAFAPELQRRLEAVDDALGLPPGTLLQYQWFTDLSSIGPSAQLALAGTLQLDGTTGRTADACTSVVGRDGDSTVHARNLDLWGMGYMQPLATLLFVEPLTATGAPDGLRYAHSGCVGEVFAGSTGVNEAGLTVSSHLHVTRDVAIVFGRMRMGASDGAWEAVTGRHPRGGASLYTLFEGVLRHTGSVAQAADWLCERRALGAWSFVLSDPSGARAVVAIDHVDAHVSHGASVNTNFYQDPAMAARELRPTRNPVEGTHRRYERASQLWHDRSGALTVGQAVEVLRDRLDTERGTRRAVSPHTILSPDTSQSVVVRTRPSGDHELWLSRPHPEGYVPAPLAEFVGLSFRDGFSPGRPAIGTVGWTEDAELDPVCVAYVEAMRLTRDADDRVAAARCLATIETDDPGIRLMAAWTAASSGLHELAATELSRFEASEGASLHHRALGAWLGGELQVERSIEAARVAWDYGLDLLDQVEPRWRPLEEPLRQVLLARIAGRRSPLPAPDLKFQDVLELRRGH